MNSPDQIAAIARQRYTVIQALRGFAALWVVLFHIETLHIVDGLTPRLGETLTAWIFRHGLTGVPIFFTISGFVIAHSVHGRIRSAGGMGAFMIRRQIRLDPPYWLSMLLAVAVFNVLALVNERALHVPAPQVWLAHLLYLQELLHLPPIQLVYWTLTYEIQFYLVYALIAWLCTAIALRRRRPGVSPLVVVLVALPFALALYSAALGTDWAIKGLFVNYWECFFVGTLAYYAGVRDYAGMRHGSMLALFLLIAVMIGGCIYRGDSFAIGSAGTGLLLFVLGRRGTLTTAFSAGGLQWLGAISYSLYILHYPTLMITSGTWQRIAGHSPFADFVGIFVLIGICLLAAHIFYRLVEGPSQALASRILRPRREAASDPAAPPSGTPDRVRPPARPERMDAVKGSAAMADARPSSDRTAKSRRAAR